MRRQERLEPEEKAHRQERCSFEQRRPGDVPGDLRSGGLRAEATLEEQPGPADETPPRVKVEEQGTSRPTSDRSTNSTEGVSRDGGLSHQEGQHLQQQQQKHQHMWQRRHRDRGVAQLRYPCT